MAEEKVKKQVNPAVIQAVKAVAVLVVICLVCVALLALCNDLLYIDDDTRLERAMQKVYEDFKLQEEVALVTEKATNSTFGKVNRVLLSTDGAYIIEALGTGGYQNGSVTLYVVIGADGKVKGWAVKENDKQSYIDRLPSSAGNTWYVGEDASVDQTLDKVMTGATISFTSEAIKNAVNMATYYYRAAILGNDVEGEAKTAVLELLSTKGYNYSAVESLAGVKAVIGTALDGANDTLTYLFVGTGDKGNVYAYVYVKEEEFKIVVVTDTEVLVSNCDETADFYGLILAKPVREISVTSSVKLYTFVTGTETAADAIVYTVVGIKGSGYMPGNYTLDITVENGEVTDIDISVDGWEDHDEVATRDNANVLATKLIGATLSNIDDKYADGVVAGASQSANMIAAAVKAALQDYAVRSATSE